MLKEIRWYLETALFLAMSFLVAWLPERIANSLGAWLGRVAFRLLKRRRRVALENIQASLPFLEAQPGWVRRSAESIALATFENLGRSLVEDCRLYHGRGARLIEKVEFRGLENYHAAAAKGRGVAFITAHCGNWDLVALCFGARVNNITVVARRQENRHLNAVLERIRKGYGNEVVYKKGALRAMLGLFKQKAVVGMLIDQAVRPDQGVLVNFLGRPAWAMKLPAYIARKSAAPMLPAFMHREGDRNVVVMYPEYLPSQNPDQEQATAEDVAGLNGYIERFVIEHPTEWYWIHRRWKGAPALLEKASYGDAGAGAAAHTVPGASAGASADASADAPRSAAGGAGGK